MVCNMVSLTPPRANRLHGLPVIDLSGDLDCYNAPALRERLFKMIENGEHDLVLDLSGVSYLDSVGVATLVAVHENVSARNGSLRVLCANRAIWRVFEITGLQRVFPIFQERTALVSSLDAK